MSEDRDRDLGAELRRAIEGQPVGVTPFSGSRLHARLAGRRPAPFWQLAGVGVVTVLLIAAVLPVVERARDARTLGPGAEPGAPGISVPSPALAATSPSTALRPLLDHQRIYLPRAGLPPVGVHVDGIATQATPEERIRSRLDALNPAKYAAFPGPLGAFNPFPLTDPNLLHVNSVAIEGDLAVVDFAIPEDDWRAATASQATGLRQELVYTATEEPGIRRVQITVNGGKPSQLDLGGPISREQVVGYAAEGSLRSVHGFGERGGPQRAAQTRYSIDEVAPGLTRFVVELDQRTVSPSLPYPDWNVNVSRNPETFNPEGGKWQLTVEIFGGADPKPGVQVVDRTPLRSITTGVGFGGTPLVYVLALDDLRPWRTSLLFDPVRIVVDIGGPPTSISGRNAVYAPIPGQVVSRLLQVSGVASAFEATVRFRVLDAHGRVVDQAGTTASNCCEAGGAFSATIQIPASVPAGAVTLEMFEPSAKDGSDLNLIRVPLEVR